MSVGSWVVPGGFCVTALEQERLCTGLAGGMAGQDDSEWTGRSLGKLDASASSLLAVATRVQPRPETDSPPLCTCPSDTHLVHMGQTPVGQDDESSIILIGKNHFEYEHIHGCWEPRHR